MYLSLLLTIRIKCIVLLSVVKKPRDYVIQQLLLIVYVLPAGMYFKRRKVHYGITFTIIVALTVLQKGIGMHVNWYVSVAVRGSLGFLK